MLFSIVSFIKVFSWATGKTVFDYVIDRIGAFISGNINYFSRFMDIYNQFSEQSVTAEEFASQV